MSNEFVNSNLNEEGSSIQQDEIVRLVRIPAFYIRELYAVINK